MELKDLIKKERARLKLTQRGLAKELKVTPSAVAHWELGTHKPTPDKIVDICTLFGISAQSFFGSDGPYAGLFIQDAAESELIATWRSLSKEDRKFCLDLIKAAAFRARNFKKS